MITVEFKDFNEMVGFAMQIIGTAKAEVKKETSVKEEVEKVIGKPVKEEVEKVTGEVAGESVKDSAEEYSLEEVRATLAVLTRSGKQKQVKDLLTSFGAKVLTSLDPKDYPALMEKAGEL